MTKSNLEINIRNNINKISKCKCKKWKNKKKLECLLYETATLMFIYKGLHDKTLFYNEVICEIKELTKDGYFSNKKNIIELIS